MTETKTKIHEVFFRGHFIATFRQLVVSYCENARAQPTAVRTA